VFSQIIYGICVLTIIFDIRVLINNLRHRCSYNNLRHPYSLKYFATSCDIGVLFRLRHWRSFKACDIGVLVYNLCHRCFHI